MARKGKTQETSMRKVREILRLKMKCGYGLREIGRSLSISHVTVGRYIDYTAKAGLLYDQIETMDDAELKRILNVKDAANRDNAKPLPDWGYIHNERKKKGVTVQLLWGEYKEVHPEGYQISQFCKHYAAWKKKLTVSLRQTHKAGEKMFVDFAGQTVPITDRHTGRQWNASIFVAVLGASNYTYAEAVPDESLPHWIGAHVRSFEYCGGVTKIIVPDNLKSGVSKACKYEPDINPTYHDMAVHYGTVIIPAHAGQPRHKAKVESGVLVVERWILAALRNRTFFSIAELNEAIGELLERLNSRPFKKLDGCRRSQFEQLEKNVLAALPATRYVFAEWKQARVNIDYHVELLGHYYSVPYSLVHERVDIRYTTTTVEMFHHRRRIASHIRNDAKGKHTTVREHMPKSHQKYLEWTPSRLIRWAGTIGGSTRGVVEYILEARPHPEQGYRSCLGILRLGKRYSNERLEAACRRAITMRSYRYKSIESILRHGLDKESGPVLRPQPVVIHKNIRGQQYFIAPEQKEIVLVRCAISEK